MRQYCLWMSSLSLLSLLVLTACQPIQPIPRAAADAELVSTTFLHELPFTEDNVVVGTLSTLKRTAAGVHVSLETTGLIPGDVYTLW